MKQTDKNKKKDTWGNTKLYILGNDLSATRKEQKKAGGRVALYKDMIL